MAQGEQGELIPGLPDDVAGECLLRLPYRFHRQAKLVSRSWKAFLSHSSFYRQRNNAGKAEPIVVVVCDVLDYRWFVPIKATTYAGAAFLYTISDQTWGRLSFPPGMVSYRCVSVGSKLLLLGGWDALTWEPLSHVYVFDFMHAAEGWRIGSPMPTARGYFAYAAVGGTVYVAGGLDPSTRRPLRSSEAYDVETDAWNVLPDMPRVPLRHSRGYSVMGRFLVAGQLFDCEGQIFDPERSSWAPVRPFDPKRDRSSDEFAQLPEGTSIWRLRMMEACTIDGDGRRPVAAGAGLMKSGGCNEWHLVRGLVSLEGGRGLEGWDDRLYFSWHNLSISSWISVQPPLRMCPPDVLPYKFDGEVCGAALLYV